jgi:hypothetical protein
MDVIGLVYEFKEAPNVNGLKVVSFGSQKKSGSKVSGSETYSRELRE